MLKYLRPVLVFPLLFSCSGLEFYSFSGTNYQPVEPLVREQPREPQPPPEASLQEKPIIHVTMEANPHLDRVPFIVGWAARVIGGDPPYKIESPSGPKSLSADGEVSGTTLFLSNKNPWELRIIVTDGNGNEGAARVVVKNTIQAGSEIALDGARLAPGFSNFHWEQVHNPDRYGEWEYVTGNEVDIFDASAVTATVKFRWPGMYRFSLTATGRDGVQTSQNIDLLVNLEKSPFRLRGAGMILQDGTYLKANLDRIRAWGGNLVAYQFMLYVPYPNSSEIIASWELPRDSVSRPPTPKDWQLADWIGEAHARGLSVLLLPTVLWLGPVEGGNYTRTSWVEVWQMHPSNRSEWFRSYSRAMQHYAAIAQDTGAEFLSLGSALGSFEYEPGAWRDMIAAVRNVYSGNITITETPGWDRVGHPAPPDFLYDENLMNFELNYTGSEGQFHPQVKDMAERFWRYLNRGHRWMVVPYMQRYGKSWLGIAYAIPNGDGVNRFVHLHGERPDAGLLLIDNQEQVDYTEASFRALAQLAESDVGDRFLGAVVWALNDWKVPETQVNWGIENRPVEKAIELWFSGKSGSAQ